MEEKSFHHKTHMSLQNIFFDETIPAPEWSSFNVASLRINGEEVTPGGGGGGGPTASVDTRWYNGNFGVFLGATFTANFIELAPKVALLSLPQVTFEIPSEYDDFFDVLQIMFSMPSGFANAATQTSTPIFVTSVEDTPQVKPCFINIEAPFGGVTNVAVQPVSGNFKSGVTIMGGYQLLYPTV
jgi:hypothetical protein